MRAALLRCSRSYRDTLPASRLCSGIMSKDPNASNPSAFLKNVLGRPVVVKLNSGVDYRGAGAATWPWLCCAADPGLHGNESLTLIATFAQACSRASTAS